MGNAFFIAQSQSEFDARVASPVGYDTFTALHSTQGVIILLTQVLFFFLVARHRSLLRRPIVLLCAVAFPDLLYGLYVVIVFLFLRVARDEPVPFGRDACQVYGIITVAPLILSVQTYTLIAYDRYKAFVTPLFPLSFRGFRNLWLFAVVLSLVAMLPSLAMGGSAVMGSGNYCVLDFSKRGISVFWLVFVALPLIVMAVLVRPPSLEPDGVRPARRRGKCLARMRAQLGAWALALQYVKTALHLRQYARLQDDVARHSKGTEGGITQAEIDAAAKWAKNSRKQMARDEPRNRTTGLRPVAVAR